MARQWYLKRSTIWTNKREAQRIANELRNKRGWKEVRVVPRKDGYWVKAKKVM